LNDLTDDVNGLIAAIEDFKVQLRERERLAAIGQTSTMIGHDLRNPLQAIFSTIFLLKRRLKGDAWSGVDPKQRAVIEQLLGVLEEQAEYMNKVVSDVQDYARNLKLEVTEIDLQQHLDSILGTIRVPATITVVNKVKGFTLKADREMLRRILTNLTLNAVQAMPEGGTLTFDACHSDGSVEITVEDSGVGIPREIMVDLFKPFYTTKSKGSGLGLAVCRRLAEAQGGYVKVESEPGKGSRFTVSFPQA
jgi:signal transduction histidine kinase